MSTLDPAADPAVDFGFARFLKGLELQRRQTDGEDVAG